MKFLLLLIVILFSTLFEVSLGQVSSDFQLIPSSITVRSGKFSLLLQSSNGNALVSCSLTEASSVAEADFAVENPACLTSDFLSSSESWEITNPIFTTSIGPSVRTYSLIVQQIDSSNSTGANETTTVTPTTVALTTSPTTSTGMTSTVISTTTIPTTISNTTVNGFTSAPITNSSFASLLPIRRDQQLLVISCCDSTNLSSSARVSVDILTPFSSSAFFNKNLGPIIFPNPGFVNVAPCPCDLTLGLCDINCCCDKDCSAFFITAFDCISGFYGGNYIADNPQYCNTTQQKVSPGWHSFTCIQYQNNPYIGEFYTNETSGLALLTTENEVNRKLASAASSSQVTRGVDWHSSSFTTNLPSSYVGGDAMFTLQSGESLNTFFTLPRAYSASGACIRRAPVEFLTDTRSTCNVQVTTETCVSGSMLDPLAYLLDNKTLFFSAFGEPVVSRTVYYCVDGDAFVKVDGSVAGTGSGYNATGSSLFPPAAASPTPALSVCTGSTALSASGGVCSNAVVNVTYGLQWQGGHVRAVTASLYLADIALTNDTADPTTVTQFFQVGFSRFNQNSTSGAPKSGNPGYDIGSPVLAYSSSSNLAAVSSLSTWSPEGNGLCAASSFSAPVVFGIEQVSGCVLRLTLADFEDCAQLRRRVETAQAQLFATSVAISRFGSPDQPDLDLISITFDATTNSTAYEGGDADNFPAQCANIPSILVYQFAYAITGSTGGYPIRELVAARISYVRENWRLDCARGFVCNESSQQAQSFGVESRVTFDAVSSDDERTGEECRDDVVCWSELLLPLTSAFYHIQPAQYANLQLDYNFYWTLILVAVAIGVFWLFQDWSYVAKQVNRLIPV